MSETVLVTGGTGFVAGWCVTELLRQGYDVRTTIRDPSREQAVRDAVSPGPGDRLEFHVADLTRDDGWAAALAGCDHVLHVASPLTGDTIAPAREGTLRVLRAAASPPLTDLDDPALTGYRRSKAVAERAAWDHMRDHTGPTTLTTILPGAVFGPLLSPSGAGSVQVIARLLRGMPVTPRIGFEIVDVRDLADLHIRAMTSPEAAGQRFIATGDFHWTTEIAALLNTRTRPIPDFAVRLLARFDPGLRALTPYLSHEHVHTARKADQILGWRTRPAAETIADCAHSLTTHGIVRS